MRQASKKSLVMRQVMSFMAINGLAELKTFYEQFGFKEFKREANWTPGGPDNVYMRRLKI